MYNFFATYLYGEVLPYLLLMTTRTGLRFRDKAAEDAIIARRLEKSDQILVEALRKLELKAKAAQSLRRKKKTAKKPTTATTIAATAKSTNLSLLASNYSYDNSNTAIEDGIFFICI